MSPRLVRSLRRTPGALLVETGLYLRLILTALFVERVYLTALFLLLTLPYLVLCGAYGRVRPSARAITTSPFVYTMQ